MGGGGEGRGAQRLQYRQRRRQEGRQALQGQVRNLPLGACWRRREAGPEPVRDHGHEGCVGQGLQVHQGLEEGEVEWNNETMFAWLANPKLYVKGTIMAFAGFKKEEDRADVIAYLNTLNPDAPPLKGH